MKKRYVLYKRGQTYYIEDTDLKRRTSLQTHDRATAEKLVVARNDTLCPSSVHLALGRVYLTAADPKLLERTWSLVIDEFCARGRESTQRRRRRDLGSVVFDPIRNQRLVETTADDLRAVLKAGGAFANCELKCLHNLALGLGWLPAPIIPSKLWCLPTPQPKRAITWEEHQRIVAAEGNVERRMYYELLWEIGAAQTDGACLTAANIDWPHRTLVYARCKTGEIACLAIGARLATLLQQLPSEGPLFPRISRTTDSARAAEFRRRCRLLNFQGINLHSYRYAWAEPGQCSGSDGPPAAPRENRFVRPWRQSESDTGLPDGPGSVPPAAPRPPAPEGEKVRVKLACSCRTVFFTVGWLPLTVIR